MQQEQMVDEAEEVEEAEEEAEAEEIELDQEQSSEETLLGSHSIIEHTQFEESEDEQKEWGNDESEGGEDSQVEQVSESMEEESIQNA